MYNRLRNFGFTRHHIKKLTMTIPYNSTQISQLQYLKEALFLVDNEYRLNGYPLEEFNKDLNKMIKIQWYAKTAAPAEPLGPENFVCTKDLRELIKIIFKIITTEFDKINKFNKYLKQTAKICSKLNVPISWNLPSGLEVHQSYLESKSIKIKPFNTIKASITLSTASSKLDKDKNMNALMPNLIHSLDGYTLMNLIRLLGKQHPDINFYCVHDCFAVTIDKIELLLSILRSVYTMLYSDDKYLLNFDLGVINKIKDMYNEQISWDANTRTFTLHIDNSTYTIPDIAWVLGDKLTDKVNINGQHILI